MSKVLRSFGVAVSGIVYGVRTQSHMRFHVAAAAVAIGLGILAALGPLEWAVIALTIALVISLELVNTAVEKAVDLACPDIHPLAKLAKDTAAGAVLVAAAISLVIGLLILGPPLWHLWIR
jgi:diacylglycerol kinase